MTNVLRPGQASPCPTCGDDCFVGVRGAGVLILNCATHGVFTIGGAGRDDVGHGTMHPEERLWVIDRALQRFQVDPDRADFMVLQSSTLPCNYVQFRYNSGELWSEVCSREWSCLYCGDRPLSGGARAAIAELGYLGGGAARNYEVRNLTGTTQELSMLAETAMIRAFDEPFDFELAVYFKRADALNDLIANLGARAS